MQVGQRHSFVAKIGDPKCRIPALRESKMPTRHFGTSLVQSADLWYLGVSEDRSVNLSNTRTHTHTHTHTHARRHARTHAHTHTHTA